MNQLRKIELGVATGIFLLLLFALLYKSVNYNVFELQHEYGYKFARYDQVFDYYKHYLLPLLAHITIVYLAFVCINSWIMPAFYERGSWKMGSLLLIATCAAVFLTIMVAYTWYNGYLFGVYNTRKGVHMHCAKSAFIITIFYVTLYALYYGVKQLYFQQVHAKIVSKPWYAQIRTEAIVILLLIVVFSVITPGNNIAKFSIFGLIGIYYGIIYFVSQYRLLPLYHLHRDRRLLMRDAAFVYLLLFALSPVFLFILMPQHSRDAILSCLALFVGAMLVVLPLSYWIFYLRQSRSDTILGLRKALDQSETGLDFLRWQINPHFLFNALNTLYGTALTEKAPATSEGIQKLGDMMRFMLHDNMQERISLSKEIAYLQNYIALQRLRTQGSSSDIGIEVNIDDTHCDHEIAPMLLIPFVENAFKHGISSRNKSRITMSLSCTPEKIYFDVYNTVHASRAGEIENDSMGIGLQNVRQRLALLYSHKHELSIRETATEYFVHLTIQVV